MLISNSKGRKLQALLKEAIKRLLLAFFVDALNSEEGDNILRKVDF